MSSSIFLIDVHTKCIVPIKLYIIQWYTIRPHVIILSSHCVDKGHTRAFFQYETTRQTFSILLEILVNQLQGFQLLWVFFDIIHER